MEWREIIELAIECLTSLFDLIKKFTDAQDAEEAAKIEQFIGIAGEVVDTIIG